MPAHGRSRNLPFVGNKVGIYSLLNLIDMLTIGIPLPTLSRLSVRSRTVLPPRPAARRRSPAKGYTPDPATRGIRLVRTTLIGSGCGLVSGGGAGNGRRELTSLMAHPVVTAPTMATTAYAAGPGMLPWWWVRGFGGFNESDGDLVGNSRAPLWLLAIHRRSPRSAACDLFIIVVFGHWVGSQSRYSRYTVSSCTTRYCMVFII